MSSMIIFCLAETPFGRMPGLARKQKIGVSLFWAQKGEIGEECRQFWA